MHAGMHAIFDADFITLLPLAPIQVEHVRKRNADVIWTTVVEHCAATSEKWRQVTHCLTLVHSHC